MNAIDISPDYKAIYSKVKERFVQSKYFNYGACDETYYTLRVFETAKEIIHRLNKKVNVSLILVSAILHDVGKSKINLSKVFLNNRKSSPGRLSAKTCIKRNCFLERRAYIRGFYTDLPEYHLIKLQNCNCLKHQPNKD